MPDVGHAITAPRRTGPWPPAGKTAFSRPLPTTRRSPREQISITSKGCLKTYGPLTIHLEADNDLYNPGPGADRGGHEVVIVGYHDNVPGENAPGGGYWIIKNSWGAGWNGVLWLRLRAIAYASQPSYEDWSWIPIWPIYNHDVCGLTGHGLFHRRDGHGHLERRLEHVVARRKQLVRHRYVWEFASQLTPGTTAKPLPSSTPPAEGTSPSTDRSSPTA